MRNNQARANKIAKTFSNLGVWSLEEANEFRQFGPDDEAGLSFWEMQAEEALNFERDLECNEQPILTESVIGTLAPHVGI